MRDPTAFRSDLLPTEHFDARFSEENVTFWVPILIADARIDADHHVLDVGCGTGGFSREIASATGAHVTGVDVSTRFIECAEARPASTTGSVAYLVGDAEKLPFPPGSFDRVLLSLVLHQLANPPCGLVEAHRVLDDGGLLLVRTIAPEDARHRVPERYLPTMAEADEARLPSVELIERWLLENGFALESTVCHLRNKPLVLDEEERALLTEVRSRYAFVPERELDAGLQAMRADALAHAGRWVDPRPTYTIVASKQRPIAGGSSW